MTRQRSLRPDDPWPQRFFVLDLIDREVEKGVTLADLASAFGLDKAYSLETGWRYNYDRKPHMNTLEKIADYFNIPISKVYDKNPSDTPRDELALAKETIEGSMGSGVVSKLTDEQILVAYRVAIAAVKAYLQQ